MGEDRGVLFHAVVATSGVVAATSSRTAKRDAIAALLKELDGDEVEAAVGFLTGEPRQGRIGIGWATLSKLDHPSADQPTLTIDEVDRALTDLATTTGAGSVGRRKAVLDGIYGRATGDEAHFLTRLLGGELRQGALAGVMADAVAAASGVPAATIRRATMLGGRLDATARLALAGGAEALAGVGLEPGRPVQPMLASTAESVAEAMAAAGPASVEWKLDGIRVQVHRIGDDITVFTRNLNDITERVPDVVAAVRDLPAERLVLDGEAMGFDPAGRPHLFQDTVSWRERPDSVTGLRPFFFDLLHLDGDDLIDEPLSRRRAAIEELAPQLAMPGRITADTTEAEAVLADALDAGHEGVVVKAVDSPYEAGRRGKAWRKVKPVHTLDLVVLAVEWGHSRRSGWLSNLHLGARDPEGMDPANADGNGNGFVMVGKTFKGLTDELLRWQTQRFTDLAEREDRWNDQAQTGVVWVRPEQVVEIALDGVQRSTRYPGGVALRFARVVRYRDDKSPQEADTITTVRALGADPG
jgi:DNA ligase-1